MANWVDVAAENALAVGEHLVVDVEGLEVVVFKLEDGFYASLNMVLLWSFKV